MTQRDPDYWRRWRAEHPDYVQRERERKRRQRAEGRRGDRSAEYRARRAKERAARAAQAALDAEASEHPTLTAARVVAESVVRPDRRSVVVDPLYEDAVAVAAETLWRFRYRSRAVREAAAIRHVTEYVRSERRWRLAVAPLLDDILAA